MVPGRAISRLFLGRTVLIENLIGWTFHYHLRDCGVSRQGHPVNKPTTLIVALETFNFRPPYWGLLVTHICIVTLVICPLRALIVPQDAQLSVFLGGVGMASHPGHPHPVTLQFWFLALASLIFCAFLPILMNYYVFMRRWLFPSLLISCRRRKTGI